MPQRLTEIEKAVICRVLLDPDFSPGDAWQFLNPQKVANNPLANGKTWLRTQRVQEYNFLQKSNLLRVAAKLQGEKMKGSQEGIQATAPDSQTKFANVDFTDRDQFLQFANQQANLIQDEKQRLDYLKILSDLMRYKEPETTTDNEIQRFYTPLKCTECKLYQSVKKGLK